MTAVGARRLKGSLRSVQAQSWTLEPLGAGGTLLLRFVGPTLTTEVPCLLATLDQQMPPGKVHLLFDIRQLEGHNSEVRAALQTWLGRHRSQIAKITVVMNKAASIFKMAAGVVGLAAGLHIQIRDDLESDGAVRFLAE